MALKKFIKQDYFFPVALILLSLALLAGLAVFAYLGTFSRYSADDYCFSRTLDQSSNILSATKAWYVKTSNRYTTMLLVGVSEWFGRSAIRFLPALAIILWLVTLAWTLFRLAEKLQISSPLISAFTLASLIIFYSILQAPSLYQSLFWRSGMVTYFMPLIAFSYLSGLLMIEGWRQKARPGLMWLALLARVWLGFFLAGGLSETTLAIQGGALGLAILMVWFLTRGEKRERILMLLFVALIASILALIAVFLAPANGLRVKAFGPSAPLVSVLSHSFIFAWDFIRETFRSYPTPTLGSVATALLLGFGPRVENTALLKRRTFLSSLIMIPLIMYILIAFSMAPSYYGQHSYPGARSLMATRAVMVTGLMAFSLLVGMSLRAWIQHLLKERPTFFKAIVGMAMIFLVLGSSYPLYASKQTLIDLPWYRYHAEQWDVRDEYIHQAVAQGATDLVVKQLDTIGKVQEIKGRAKNWVNRCAAGYYGLDTISAPSSDWTAP